MVGAQIAPQPLVGGEMPGYERQTDVLETFHVCKPFLEGSKVE